ncbi:cysteine--tRNA ligase [Candidatus Uhrbacteria bacterium]|nr:cysteine--tRNA ligase [Candidatus Uhrbacteria bacterium]
MIMLYNTRTRKKELFMPREEHIVGMYSCGPTVYNYPHIGNYRAYVCSDLLARALAYLGYSVKHIMNITDVDDKTIRDSQKEGVSLKEFTARYEQAFLEDIASLRIRTITRHTRATEHIEEMVSLIQALLKKGIAYRGEDGSIYYSIEKFPSYGALSGLRLQDLEAGASGRMQADEYEKEHAQDFALWKAWVPSDGEAYWETPLGKGRPGWHIECSAMSMKYLGQQFDIHCGGTDLIFPHHENEIAQSEGAYGGQFVRYWIHNAWLLVDGKKMAKSAGNFYTLRDVMARGVDPLAFKFFCLTAHYRQPMNFTWEALASAQQGLCHVQSAALHMKEMAAHAEEEAPCARVHQLVDQLKADITSALHDDVNSPQALAALFDFIKAVYKEKKSFTRADYLELFRALCDSDRVFGFCLEEIVIPDIPHEVRSLMEERERARKEKQWEKADEFRMHIEEKGYAIEDTSHGPRAVKR